MITSLVMIDNPLEKISEQILTAHNISASTTRVEILKAILLYKGRDFTIAGLHDTLKKGKVYVGLSTIITTLVIFKRRGIVIKATNYFTKELGKNGRPVTRLCLAKEIVVSLDTT